MSDISLSMGLKGGGLSGFITRAQETFEEWAIRARGRKELATMNARELSDIGLSQAGQSFEVSKPFWRP